MLGSGTSTGVPRIGEDWGECDPADPRNRRSRVSIIIESAEGKRLLVDTSPDLRHQLLANGIDKVDAVFWTHDHADHCHGIDDLRVMRYDRSGPLPGFAGGGIVPQARSEASAFPRVQAQAGRLLRAIADAIVEKLVQQRAQLRILPARGRGLGKGRGHDAGGGKCSAGQKECAAIHELVSFCHPLPS